jgi:hypothetical protein
MLRDIRSWRPDQTIDASLQTYDPRRGSVWLGAHGG